ncbi:1977_t:CDS:2 [Acaulospora morrowiae]|uniref:1977_t:CDS:1 n=1 Tax=Acaulospora morrowiae TaxID=94023 RepID=A0A9N8VLB3_9GLOM|nr:1977_t:CDS:2 [Acaulospora morrowiae]
MNKQSTFLSITLVFFIACLLSLSQAIPITDVSSTSVLKMKDTAGRLVVSVKRVDDLVDDEGTWLAERISAVIFNFELMDDNLLLDSMPVRFGVKNIQVLKARVVPVGTRQEDVNKYEENFEIGLVKVEVNANVKQMSPLPKIVISIKVIEIDGVIISSSNTVENTWEFELSNEDRNSKISTIQPADDNVSSYRPCSSLGSIPRRLHRWWRCSSKYTRIFISSLFVTIMFGLLHSLISVTTKAVIQYVSPSNKFHKYRKVLQEESGDYKYKGKYGEVAQVIFVADEYKFDS